MVEKGKKTAFFLTKFSVCLELITAKQNWEIFPWYISMSPRVMIGQFSVLHTKARLIQKY